MQRPKNKTKPPKPQPPKPPTPPAVKPAAPAVREPTPDQTRQLQDLEQQVGALNARHGVPPARPFPEPPGATLEESLLRAAGLLGSTLSHLKRAEEKEAEAKKEVERLATQKRDQEEALRLRKKEAEEEIALTRAVANANIKERTELQGLAEQELSERTTACEKREKAATKREAEARTKEADLLARVARLAERETNAEQGFAVEKARVFEPVEAEIRKLREERDRLTAEISRRKAKDEEEARTTHLARAEKWAGEDAERTKREAEHRRAFDAEMTTLRQEKLAALRADLAEERKRAEQEDQAARAARSAALDEREADLDRRQRELGEQAREQHVTELDLEADKQILHEDRAALDRKVERLVSERTEDLRHEVAALSQQLDDARGTRDAYFADIEAQRELNRRFGDRTPKQILADLTKAERQRDEFARQLDERPDAGVAERLVTLERERSAWFEEKACLQGDLARARGELATRRLSAIELESLRGEKEALEVHKRLLDLAVDELSARVDDLTRQENRRNPMTALTSLDGREDLQTEVRTTRPLGPPPATLADFAEDLRHRIALGVEGRQLYYSKRDVRAFLGGLAMTRLLLLQGISGTGKTSLPLAFAAAVDGGIEVVEVQAGWRDRQDLIGYFNSFHMHYYASNFLQALYRAGTPAYKDRLFIMVLDEINLSRPEQFFADFLSALEQPMDQRRLTLVNDPVPDAPRLMVEDRHLPIPPNVWFVGTANHDETTAEFADKTYDRAHVMEMPRVTEAAHFTIEEKRRRGPISYLELQHAFAAAAVTREKDVSHATKWLRDAPFVASLDQRFRVGWGNRLENQIASYLPVVVEAGGSVGEAMDHLLATKVLRKLKDRHDVRTKGLEELRGQILTAWKKLDNTNPPERCQALIDREVAAKKGEEQE